jgi:pyridoxal phosphate enzyme (YggS family)
MSEIAKNIKEIEESLNGKARLIAVTKTKPVSVLEETYNYGFRRFGENKVQEMVAKHEVLPKDVEWHLIGHLQSNKVKYAASFVTMIHSVDSLKLLKEINKEAAKHQRVIDCLLQIFIADEDTKFGLSPAEAEQILNEPELETLQYIRIVGLMGMASNTEDQEQIRQEFRGLRTLFEAFKKYNGPRVSIHELSMGMSGDYPIAVEEGSTLVRVGSAIFGHR